VTFAVELQENDVEH